MVAALSYLGTATVDYLRAANRPVGRVAVTTHGGLTSDGDGGLCASRASDIVNMPLDLPWGGCAGHTNMSNNMNAQSLGMQVCKKSAP